MMINVTPTAATKITELLIEENKTDARPARVRAGRRVFGLPVRPDDRRGRGGRVDRSVIESNGVKLLVDPISARYLQRRRSRFRGQHHRRRLHDQEPEREVDLRLRIFVQRLTGSAGSTDPASRPPGPVCVRHFTPTSWLH